jgi:hypothetical protein
VFLKSSVFIFIMVFLALSPLNFLTFFCTPWPLFFFWARLPKIPRRTNQFTWGAMAFFFFPIDFEYFFARVGRDDPTSQPARKFDVAGCAQWPSSSISAIVCRLGRRMKK